MSVLVIKANALKWKQNELRMKVNELQKELVGKIETSLIFNLLLVDIIF